MAPDGSTQADTSTTRDGSASIDTSGSAVGYTHHRADGNRWVDGVGSLPVAAPLDIPVDGTPRWLVAVPFADGSAWVVVLEDGTAQAVVVDARTPVAASVAPARLAAGAPPLVYVEAGRLQLADFTAQGASPTSAPTLVDAETSTFAFLTEDGQVVLTGDLGTESLPLDALADARLLLDEDRRLLVLSGPTSRYAHGVLGDAIEATGVSLLETDGGLRLVGRFEVAAPAVVEGLAPIWADVDGDGDREVVVTVSQQGLGARQEIYSESGRQLATGPWIGAGFRWRHQVASGPLAPDGRAGLVVVRTPHIGGRVEFYRWVDANLRLEAVETRATYQSHVIYARNLDMALAGDFDGDGRAELLAPTQARTALGAIGWDPAGAATRWQVSVGGRVTTNLAAVDVGDGRVAVGVGHDGGAVRLWLP